MFKYSKQRNLIHEYLKSTKEHPTAETIYAVLKEKEPALSLATVYRNLNLLVQMGEIDKLDTGQAKDRFDANTKRHDHFVCNECGRVYDLGSASAFGSDDYKKIKTEHTISDHALYLYGICGECKPYSHKN